LRDFGCAARSSPADDHRDDIIIAIEIAIEMAGLE